MSLGVVQSNITNKKMSDQCNRKKLMFIPKNIQKLAFGLVRKLPWLRDPKWVNIKSIWTHLRPLNHGALAPPKCQFLSVLRYRRILCSMLMLSSFSLKLQADCDFSTSKTHNELSPCLRLLITPFTPLPQVAMVMLGEASPKNYRASSTFGFFPTAQHRFKFTGEGLVQKLDYRFSSGKVSRWNKQWAIGGDYQFILNNFWITSFDIFMSYNHAQSTSLSDVACLSSPTGISSVSRQLAGSRWFAAGAGFTFSPWHRSAMRVALSYDRIEYLKKFQRKHWEDGVGVEISFFQNLARFFDLNLKAELRYPYEYFEALLNWTSYLRGGYISVGVFGGFTSGKNGLPDENMYGIQVSYMLGGNPVINDSNPSYDPCSYDNACNRPILTQDWTGTPRCFENYCDLVQWTSIPAIYVPEVLVVKEQQLN